MENYTLPSSGLVDLTPLTDDQFKSLLSTHVLVLPKDNTTSMIFYQNEYLMWNTYNGKLEDVKSNKSLAFSSKNMPVCLVRFLKIPSQAFVKKDDIPDECLAFRLMINEDAEVLKDAQILHIFNGW